MSVSHHQGARSLRAVPFIPRVAAAAAVLAVVCFTGCRERDVTAYRAPKDRAAAAPAGPVAMSGALPDGHPPLDSAAPPAQPGGGMAGTTMPTAEGEDLTWTAPAGWTAAPGRAMRKGSFIVTGASGTADVAITAFPGDVGGELANVNRWRGQMQLPPIAAAELEPAFTRFESHGLRFAVVDLAGGGDGGSRMISALVPHGGATWFFKMTGPDALVAGEKPAFLEFLHSVQPRAATP